MLLQFGQLERKGAGYDAEEIEVRGSHWSDVCLPYCYVIYLFTRRD
jgi:hypothetical protein